MRILIDADGCPVVDESIRAAKPYKVEVLILCDTSHVFEKAGAKTLTFSKGADSVDFALVNLVQRDDLVVTQDYGLAAMCLAKNAIVISQDGLEYTSENIGSLLMSRHASKKLRGGGVRLKGPAKRTRKQDSTFVEKLTKLLEQAYGNCKTKIEK